MLFAIQYRTLWQRVILTSQVSAFRDRCRSEAGHYARFTVSPLLFGFLSRVKCERGFHTH
jgi:hypothetical protein